MPITIFFSFGRLLLAKSWVSKIWLWHLNQSSSVVLNPEKHVRYTGNILKEKVLVLDYYTDVSCLSRDAHHFINKIFCWISKEKHWWKTKVSCTYCFIIFDIPISHLNEEFSEVFVFVFMPSLHVGTKVTIRHCRPVVQCFHLCGQLFGRFVLLLFSKYKKQNLSVKQEVPDDVIHGHRVKVTRSPTLMSSEWSIPKKYAYKIWRPYYSEVTG